ncbi:hypothetical protein, partial [Xanthomonas axonopodis]|uniref:hypothetical protein n=1 Tax=Xanthomonas axonopodis TaxID=53413 RepID=UPI001C0E758D
GTPASACFSVAMICVSVNFDVRMEPPDLGTMPERSTYAVSADRGSLRSDLRDGHKNPVRSNLIDGAKIFLEIDKK